MRAPWALGYGGSEKVMFLTHAAPSRFCPSALSSHDVKWALRSQRAGLPPLAAPTTARVKGEKYDCPLLPVAIQCMSGVSLIQCIHLFNSKFISLQCGLANNVATDMVALIPNIEWSYVMLTSVEVSFISTTTSAWDT